MKVLAIFRPRQQLPRLWLGRADADCRFILWPGFTDLDDPGKGQVQFSSVRRSDLHHNKLVAMQTPQSLAGDVIGIRFGINEGIAAGLTAVPALVIVDGNAD